VKLSTSTLRKHLIGDARDEIAKQAGKNKILSRKEQAALPKDLQRMAEKARSLKGAAISVNDVVDSFASYSSQVLEKINKSDPKYITDDEVATIKDQALRQRVLAAGGETTETPATALEDFECTLGDSGREPDFDIFGNAPPAKTQTIVPRDQAVGALLVKGQPNPKLIEAGLTKTQARAAIKTLREGEADPYEGTFENASWEFEEVKRLYSATGKPVGYEITFGDVDGIINGSVFVTQDNKCTFGDAS
jgi:hypothetical protein